MDDLARILRSAPDLVAAAGDLEELAGVEARLVGRRSRLAELQRGIGGLPPEERPAVGQAVREAKAALDDLLARRRAELERAAADTLLVADRVDLTVPAVRLPVGSRHLITQTIDEIAEIFIGLGYRIAEGPEAELGWYNFDALNTPATHPARAESDTLYLAYGSVEDEALLRTQTSPMQVRWMEANPPPAYLLMPGKVYRADTIDATHLPVFHQIEGLAVDTDITFAGLKGTLAHFAREFFGSGVVTRLRPHFFPFTEPSAELDVSCFACDGGEAGCRVCGGAGWLEMAGCGMVDPNVFAAVGYDPDEVTGFAFGMGVERLAMVRHGITSIRHFVDNDLRFLSQVRS